MMKIRYFSWLREKIGTDQEELDIPASVKDGNQLIAYLSSLSARHAGVFIEKNAIRMAIDQHYADHDHSIENAKEIAFFPPVTGG